MGSLGSCFLVQPELVISCDVTFKLTYIYFLKKIVVLIQKVINAATSGDGPYVE